MKIVIIDNYDSFTYNLSHLFKELGNEVSVQRNDQIEWNKLDEADRLVLSPGPGIPSESGDLLEVIHRYADKKPILGVCLGEQAIGEAFGASLVNLNTVFHGIQSNILITGNDSLFYGLSGPIKVGRYHSWIISEKDFPACLQITARSEEGQIMAIRHRTLPIKGLQFHPESVLTPDGKRIISNWLQAND